MKVLDFGLAKAFAGDESDVNLSQSPTLSMQATAQGVILGTAAYMSPEQARGQEVDKRADVWAFGCVLYEMLTGRQVWSGPTVTDMIAAAVAKDPDFTALPANIHPRIQELQRRCLEKEPKNRWQAIGDVRVEVQQLLAEPDGLVVQPVADVIQAPPRSILPWALATFGLVIVATVAGWYLKPETATPHPVARFAVEIPEGDVLSLVRVAVALSPDDKYLVYSANDQLYLREVAQMGAVPIRGTEGAVNPFFSWDSQWIGFAADGQLKKVAIVVGGPPVPLCEAADLLGANWLPDDTIVFSPGPENVMRVSANGGEPAILVSRDSAAGETAVVYPNLLPDGDTLLFAVASGQGADDVKVVTQSISTGERRVLLPGGIPVRYLTTGHVVYMRKGVLLAAPFDPARGEVTGGSFSLVEGIAIAGPRYGHVTISASGSLAYLPGLGSSNAQTMVWVDRDGAQESLGAPPFAWHPIVSPDGTRVALEIRADEQDSWIWDLRRDTADRLTTSPAIDRFPIWADDERVVFRSERSDGASNLYLKRADGTGDVTRLTTSANDQFPDSVSPNGQTLVFDELSPDTGFDLYTVSLEGGQPELLLQTEFNEQLGIISPDGNWLAYDSDESGRREIYVRSFPDLSGRQQVSTNGGAFPRWGRDGSELFYQSGIAPTSELMRVSIRSEGSLSLGTEERLFSMMGLNASSGFDVSPDGRFLMVTARGTADSQINVVLNWFEELKERMPVP